MKLVATSLPGVTIVEPDVFADDRGSFMESFNVARYAAIGVGETFVQDNLSRSKRGVLRGLHLQHPHGQAKLISVLDGEVFDVAVDVRVGSPTFARWCGERLSADNGRQMYIPPGFAHGFLVLSDVAVFSYKCSAYYRPAAELTVRWNDPRIGIDWPEAPSGLSAKDASAPALADIPPERLPAYAPEAAASGAR